MALIYAFRDEQGTWHGAPGAATDAPSMELELTYQPEPSSSGAATPFAGQRLTVLSAPIEGPPGWVAYDLDGGGYRYATDQVQALLKDPKRR